MNLHELLEQVTDEETLIKFLGALTADKRDEDTKEKQEPSNQWGPGHNGWENTTVADYLDAITAWAETSKNGLPLMPKEENPWKRFADMLYAGKINE